MGIKHFCVPEQSFSGFQLIKFWVPQVRRIVENYYITVPDMLIIFYKSHPYAVEFFHTVTDLWSILKYTECQCMLQIFATDFTPLVYRGNIGSESASKSETTCNRCRFCCWFTMLLCRKCAADLQKGNLWVWAVEIL